MSSVRTDWSKREAAASGLSRGSGTDLEFLVWLRGPYRNLGIGRQCLGPEDGRFHINTLVRARLGFLRRGLDAADDDRVLDAHTTDTRQVDARFDGDDVVHEQRIIGRRRDPRRFVDLQADAVTGGMRERVGPSRLRDDEDER